MHRSIEKHIPGYVTALLARLAERGHRGYLVGGSLRDILRGVAPHDFDLTTDATPTEMLDIFAGLRTIPTGLAHGTLTVLSEGNPVEITTHRKDGSYTDSRHPDAVTFTRDIEKDLARRDFTVNAMAWSAETGLVDPFGGMRDLQAGILRAVGEAELRFSEDALRILRAFRFAAQLDFNIEKDTLTGAKSCVKGLADISVERIFAELSRTVTAPAAKKGLAALLDTGAAPYVFFDMLPDRGALDALSLLPPKAPLRFAALLHKSSAEQLATLARRWHASNAFVAALSDTVAAFSAPVPCDAFEARRFVCHHYPHFEDALLLRAALTGEDTAAARALTRRVLSDGTAVEIRRLAVNGRELQEKLGVRPQKTGLLLSRLQEIVWREPRDNRRDALLLHAKAILEKEKEFYE